jgi:phosphate transport system permease protein
MATLADPSPADPGPANPSPAYMQPPVSPRAGLPPDVPRAVSATTTDYWFTLIGAGIGAFALTWLLFHILPFSGDIGFVICWYLVYLAMFACVTAVKHSRPIVIDRIWTTIITGAAFLVGFALVSTIWYTAQQGWPALHHLNLITKSASAGNLNGSLNHGGILNAMVGTLIEVGIATAIAMPLGITTAVFMAEVGGRFARVVRTVVEAMTALPDILAGLFIYTLLIIGLGVQKSGFAAAMALTVMMLPITARSAYVQLRVVPGGLREASLALGAPQWRTVWRVVIPTGRSGLTTAVILGMARIVGETAPVFITSGFSTFMNVNPLNNTMNSLPLYIFTGARSGENLFIERAFAAGIVLLAIVLVLFATARFLSRSKVARR